MGKEALDSADVDSTDDGDQTEDQNLDAGDDQSDSDDDQGTKDQEVEIVLPADDGSPPKPQHYGIRKRINKLNARNEAAEGRATDAESKLEVTEAQNKLLRLALDQKDKNTEPNLPPDPADFDDGAKDPGYVTALNGYTQQFIDAAIAKRAPQQNTAPPIDAGLERKQTAHYEAAGKLGVKDYDAVEDVALGILGSDTVNRLISATDSSPRVLYYLGKNPDAASEIAELIKSDPVAGVLKLGALGATLKVKPRQKSSVAPDPDDEFTGAVNKSTKRRGPKGATFT